LTTSRFDRKLERILRKTGGYFRENPGAIFIMIFLALLVPVAALLSLGPSALADKIAGYAFDAFVIGVIIQIVVVIRKQGGKRCND
jgi:hypothetical protein